MTPRPFAQAPLVLDSRTLGRPVHLMGAFARLFHADLVEHIGLHLNRRYKANFLLSNAKLSGKQEDVAGLLWQVWGTDVGRVACTIERPILLAILHHRYGLAGAFDLERVSLAAPSSTELRLAAMLGMGWAQLLVQRLMQPHAGEASDAKPEMQQLKPATSPVGEWVWQATLTEATSGVSGVVRLSLDEACVSGLLKALSPARERRVTRSGDEAEVLRQLPLQLRAQLLEQPMTLGQLFDMRVGDVIPVHLSSAQVFVDDACLFRALVAEHKGQLCLTSFEDVE